MEPNGPTAPGEYASLRDYFAAAALTGILATLDGFERSQLESQPEIAAEKIFKIADAMLAARKK